MIIPGWVLALCSRGIIPRPNRLAVATGAPPHRINQVVRRKRAITADTALLLRRYCGVDAQFWLNLYAQDGLEVAKGEVVDQLKAVELRKAA